MSIFSAICHNMKQKFFTLISYLIQIHIFCLLTILTITYHYTTMKEDFQHTVD